VGAVEEARAVDGGGTVDVGELAIDDEGTETVEVGALVRSDANTLLPDTMSE
jgi:hypothetical protein